LDIYKRGVGILLQQLWNYKQKIKEFTYSDFNRSPAGSNQFAAAA
jgi:hypothetical protein